MDLIADTDVATNWGIITNSRMQTNVENIYAAGDVAETFDIATEQHTVNALWTCAIQQGKAAGYKMVGIDREYDGSVGMNSINFPGVDLISFGVVRAKPGDGYEVLVENHPHLGVYKKAVLKDNRIKGLVLVNSIDNAGILLSLLGRKVDISDIKHEILSDKFNYAKLMASRGGEEFDRYRTASQART
jgi:NAD(P)H-nitrite reductase large subunit